MLDVATNTDRPYGGRGYLVRGKMAAWSPTDDLIACASTSTVRIDIAPRDTPIYAGAGYPLRAHLADRYGNAVAGTLTFAATAGSVKVSNAGVVQGTSIGRGRITVQGGTMTDSDLVSVVPRARLAALDRGLFVGNTLGYAQQELDGSGHRWIAITGQTPTSYAPSNDPAPRWIPGTGRLVFSRTVNGAARLFVGDSTGASQRLTDASFAAIGELDPEVSGDGKWVYFGGNEPGGSQAIWQVASAGGVPALVLRSTPLSGLRSPALSADATQLAYAGPSTPPSNVLVLLGRDLATSATRQLGPTRAAGVRWSPTGEWILYAESLEYPGYSGVQHLVHPDGTGDRAINSEAYLPGGAWTPDGKYLLLTPGSGASRPELIEVATGLRVPLAYRTPMFGATFRRWVSR